MTMLSFRVEPGDADDVTRWAERLGVHRSEILRAALHDHLRQLANEHDATLWAEQPLEEGELALAELGEWGPAEDWADWADAAR